jgi:hypothetical protein
MDRIGRECRNDRVWRAGWVAVAAARYVGNGVLGSVYESSRDLTALPLYPFLLASLVAVGQALGLSEPPAPTATMYFLLAPFTVGLAMPLLHSSAGSSGMPARGEPRYPRRSGWTALFVAVRCWAVYGHGEDALELLGLFAGERSRMAAAGLASPVALVLFVRAVDWPHASRAPPPAQPITAPTCGALARCRGRDSGDGTAPAGRAHPGRHPRGLG